MVRCSSVRFKCPFFSTKLHYLNFLHGVSFLNWNLKRFTVEIDFFRRMVMQSYLFVAEETFPLSLISTRIVHSLIRTRCLQSCSYSLQTSSFQILKRICVVFMLKVFATQQKMIWRIICNKCYSTNCLTDGRLTANDVLGRHRVFNRRAHVYTV